MSMPCRNREESETTPPGQVPRPCGGGVASELDGQQATDLDFLTRRSALVLMCSWEHVSEVGTAMTVLLTFQGTRTSLGQWSGADRLPSSTASREAP
jgi:hypothetical protein